MLPDFSELVNVMNRVVEELQKSQKIMQENTRATKELTAALET